VPTRRFIIVSSLAATALIAGGLAASTRRRSEIVGGFAAAPAEAAPAPGPSETAKCMAKYLQTSLQTAKLDDAMTAKIAGDIDGFLDSSKSFRNRGLRNSDEPDFAFSPLGSSNHD
jgi:hypothetical protein